MYVTRYVTQKRVTQEVVVDSQSPQRRIHNSTMKNLEALRKVSDEGVEYWHARDLVELLGYSSFARLTPVLDRVRDALSHNGLSPSHHIARTGKMVVIGSGAQREAADFFLTRAACYLLAMNGDPSKPEIADAQAYFAVQARRSELADAERNDRKRLQTRDRVRNAAKRVAAVARDKGVQRFPLFHNARYEGLYEKSSKEVHGAKGVPAGESLLDHAGPLELAAHAFQMELASEKLANDFKSGEEHAISANRDVARSVRQTMIKEVGHGPESLQLEREPIKALEARMKKGWNKLFKRKADDGDES